MKFIIGQVFIVILFVTLTSTTVVQGRFDNIIRRRRQSTTCVFTYLTLSSDEQQCLTVDSNADTSDSSFSLAQLERLCSSEICIGAAKKLLKGCKVNSFIT